MIVDDRNESKFPIYPAAVHSLLHHVPRYVALGKSLRSYRPTLRIPC